MGITKVKISQPFPEDKLLIEIRDLNNNIVKSKDWHVEDTPNEIEVVFESIMGQKVRISEKENWYLRLSEVEVYGKYIEQPTSLSPSQVFSSIPSSLPSSTPTTSSLSSSLPSSVPSIELSSTPSTSPTTSSPTPGEVGCTVKNEVPLIVTVKTDNRVKKDKTQWKILRYKNELGKGQLWKYKKNGANQIIEIYNECVHKNKCYKISLSEKKKTKKKNYGLKKGYVEVNFNGETTKHRAWKARSKRIWSVSVGNKC